MGAGADDEALIEKVLRAALDRVTPSRLRSALEDAVLGGGGRVRPRLCVAVARAASGGPPPPLAHAAGAAIELLHCASLVHDDLPCFDDADVRRGRPTVHRAYGEPMAVLAGDGLIVAAFDLLARAGAPARAFGRLAHAAGASGGLVSGQAFELEERIDLTRYHAAKTAALFEAAAALGAEAAGADGAPFAALGRSIGLFYQLADDASDVFGDPSVLGKPVQQDAAHHRPSGVRDLATAESADLHLRRAAGDVLEGVPECPGRRELLDFVALALDRLIARSGVRGRAAADASAVPLVG